VRTGGQLEPLSQRDPFLVVAAKPLLCGHADPASPISKTVILTPRGGAGEKRGTIKISQAGCGVESRCGRLKLCQIPSAKTTWPSDDNSATSVPKCDQSEVKDSWASSILAASVCSSSGKC
jgi:hypothetical protein